MAFSKVKEVRIWGVTNQNSDTRITAGDSSGGTFTRQTNPLRGTLMWDRCVYIMHGVSVAGGATGGSYTVTIETDAVRGFTGLPIARATIGPLTANRVVMTNLHDAPHSPLPTHCFIDQTATGGGIWFQIHALAKQYRGVLGNNASGSAERIVQGVMLRGTNQGGFADSRGFDEDSTVTLGTTGSAMGMHRLRLWDSVCYWAVAGNTLAGTHDVDIISTIGGRTFSVASTGAAGTITTAGSKTAITSNMNGQSPNPTHIIWTEVSAGGVSDARIVVLAKSGRGSLAKE